MIGAHPAERRYRLIHFSPDLLAELIGEGTSESIAEERVPDLRVVAVRENDWRGIIELLVWSASFDIVADGLEPPIWTPAFKYVYQAVPA